MEPGVRAAIIFVGLLFVFLFGGSALVVAGRDGFDFLTLISLVIAGLILLAVIAAIRQPPEK
ncbi:MAG TPA: hypothetical protein VE662_06105 [Solirubrobacterales bacterium]|nr:hypothetical protein [Solirubrobacterales bacterium]